MKEYTDTERLDWLANQKDVTVEDIGNEARAWMVFPTRATSKTYPTFREAIDAEMAREESK